MSFRVEENGQFRGRVSFLDADLNAGCVEAKHVKVGAGLEASKLEHQHRAVYAQESATACADEARVAHVVKGTAGTLKTFKAGCVVACVGDSTITVDLTKDGVSVLTAAISLSVAQAAYQLVEGVIDSAAVAAGDVLEVVIDGTVGTGTLGLGVFAFVDLHEAVD